MAPRSPDSVRHVSRTCRGAALFEVIVALTILAIAGVSSVALTAECVRAVARAREVDQRTRAASAFLTAVSLWTRHDLDRRLGERRQGPWRLRIERPVPTLYVVVLSDTAFDGRSAHAARLTTSLFRPEPDRDER
jgi:hypothetical protein